MASRTKSLCLKELSIFYFVEFPKKSGDQKLILCNLFPRKSPTTWSTLDENQRNPSRLILEDQLRAALLFQAIDLCYGTVWSGKTGRDSQLKR